MNIHFDSKYSDQERRDALYAGDIFVYSRTPATSQICGMAELMLKDAFAPHDPMTVDQHLSKEECASILATVKPAFTHHRAHTWALPDLIGSFGADCEATYFDVPRFRSAYPTTYLTSGIAYAFPPHRDTWYAAPACQINWWMPISEITPRNCMAFFPRYFDRQILNNSEVYNPLDWRPTGAADAAKPIQADPAKQPRPLESVDDDPFEVICPPGGLILFSAAHLHSTVPNTSGVARYSTDFRTIHGEDFAAGRGAPQVDNRCQGSTVHEFRRCSDLGKL